MIYIKKNSKTPIYMQIYSQIKEDILSGAINKGTILEGSRTLSKTLGVGRNAVNNAYAQLAVEGYIQSQKGVGFIVLNLLDEDLATNMPSIKTNTLDHKNYHIKEDEYKYDFKFGAFPFANFPVSLWRRYTNEILYSDELKAINQYPDKLGNIEFREELKKYLKRSRGVNCSEEQIVVGCGLHYLLDIICKLIGNQNKKIAMEDPGYHGSRRVFMNNDYTISPITITEKGLDHQALEKSNANAVYVTPSHQFPLGSVMSMYERKYLLHWAILNHTYIIEDDYDSEFRYNTRPIPSLQSIDQNERVIYIGTFSKTLSPSMRVNYMVLPNHLLLKYKEIFSSYQVSVPWIIQRILYKFLASSEYERYLRKTGLIYKKKHDTLVQALSKTMSDKIIIHGIGAGMHLVLEFINGEDQEWLIKQAKEFGVKVYPTKPYWINKSKCKNNTLFIGFGMLDENQIIDGITILNKAWFNR